MTEFYEGKEKLTLEEFQNILGETIYDDIEISDLFEFCLEIYNSNEDSESEFLKYNLNEEKNYISLFKLVTSVKRLLNYINLYEILELPVYLIKNLSSIDDDGEFEDVYHDFQDTGFININNK